MLVKDLNILLVTGAGSALRTRAHQKFSDGAVLSWKMPFVRGENAVPGLHQLHQSPRGIRAGGLLPRPHRPRQPPLGSPPG